VAGNTYIEPVGLYAKIFALGWFFQLRSEEGQLRQVPALMSNNIIYKRKQFLKYQFPDEPETTRGACSRLAERLTKDKICMYMNDAAQVSHPPPNGIKHFFCRALAEGRDYMMPVIKNEGRQKWLLRVAYRRVRDHLKRSIKSIINNYPKVRLPAIAVPLAILQMSFYYFLYYIGEIMTLIAPASMQKRFQI